MTSRDRPGAIALAFVVSALSSMGLGVVYALGGQPQIEGALLGLALGGAGVGLVLWSKRMMPAGDQVEEHRPLVSTEEERIAFVGDLYGGSQEVGRRGFLGRLLAGALGALGLAALFPIRSLGPRPGDKLLTTAWSRGARLVTEDGEPVHVDDLAFGSVLTVFPEGHTDRGDSVTLLIRMAPARLKLAPSRRDWAPEGYVACSKLCTHAGCPVGLFEAERGHLFCPCHQSVFDVPSGAAPLSGPAARPLPQLPLRVDTRGFLRADGDFEAPVGAAFWRLGS